MSGTKGRKGFSAYEASTLQFERMRAKELAKRLFFEQGELDVELDQAITIITAHDAQITSEAKRGGGVMELRKTFRFEASHVLPRHPGKCARLHGHSWVLHICVEGPINADTGFVQDFAEISEVVKPLIERLDHHHLGVRMEEFEPEAMPFAVPPLWCVQGMPSDFYPTSENLLVWIGKQLEGKLAWSKLSIEETCTSMATYTYKERTDNASITSDNDIPF